MMKYVIPLTSEEKTIEFASGLFPLLQDILKKDYLMLYIKGNLGAGKSVFSRALIRSTGYTGNIPSPTYSLLESYKVDKVQIHHLDLYRFGDFSELEMLGFYDFLTPQNLFLIEWPQILGDNFKRVIEIQIFPDDKDENLRYLHFTLDVKELGKGVDLEDLLSYLDQHCNEIPQERYLAVMKEYKRVLQEREILRRAMKVLGKEHK